MYSVVNILPPVSDAISSVSINQNNALKHTVSVFYFTSSVNYSTINGGKW